MASYKDYILGMYTSLGRDDETAAKEILMAYTYGRDLESGLYITGNPDLSDSRSETRYNNIIKRIIEAKPKEYFTADFSGADKKQVLEYALYIINIIFGSSKEVLETFYEYVKCIHLTGVQEPLDGCSYQMLDTDNNVHHEVMIPSLTSTSSVVCLLHEFAHFYFQKNNIPYQKFYYQEILSILFEKIATDMVADVSHDPEFTKKIENIRLDGINYHYTTKKEDLKSLLSAIRQTTIDAEYARQLGQDYRDFSQGLAESYGLGYIYAESLFQLYKTDPMKFQQKMRELFCKQTTLQDTLDYYDINLRNKQVFEKAKEKIRVMTK